MKRDDRMQELKTEYENIKIPEEGLTRMKESIEKAKTEKQQAQEQKQKIIRFRRMKRTAAGAVAAAALCIILPNVNENVAMAMEKVPLLGDFVRAVTFDRYDFDNENYNAKVEIPKLEAENSSGENAAQQINQSVKEYTDQLVNQFKQDVEQDGKGHEGLDISYEVVTDNEAWFTLKLTALETKASGHEQIRFYHIDKASGKVMSLKDLFQDGFDYISVFSDNIKAQMRKQMANDESKMYFIDSDMPETDFTEIAPDQNFYFNETGDLVIVFDEYEAAPGSMGNPEFVIPKDLWSGEKAV